MKVTWDQETCVHAGVCVKSLPQVFKVENGAFIIDIQGASDEEISKVVQQCPSGALKIDG
ncbi:MAG: (4Fe-4S)-binding protein [Methylococcaceae bacterium]